RRLHEQQAQAFARGARAVAREGVVQACGLITEALEGVWIRRTLDAAQVEHLRQRVFAAAHLPAQRGELVDDRCGLERQGQELLTQLGDLLHQFCLTATREARVI